MNPPKNDRDTAAQTIAGEYEILGEIGRGAYGVVYRCRDKTLGRVVAVKMLIGEDLDPRTLEEFIDEGRKLATLSHPNVVHVYRAGTHQDRPYLVMEYVRGQTLRQLLGQTALPLNRALEIMAQVASGLSAIHHAGVVHRDLSSNNVMVANDGTAKILDLGLARFADRTLTASATNYIVGTVQYIAPEVVEGRRATPPADVFSYGVMLYEMTGGQNPFAADNPRAILYNITSREPTPLDDLTPGLPRRLIRFVESCLAKNPADRPTDIGDAAEMIAECLPEISSSQEIAPIITRSVTPKRSSGSANPYHNRSMIRHPGEFFGRARELRRIYSRLNASPPGCISVVGDRRIGKSSLLNFVCMPINQDKHLERPENMVMVFLDLQEHPDTSLESFLRILMDAVCAKAKGRIALPRRSPTLDGVKETVQDLAGKGLKLVVLFDEFEAITTNRKFTLDVYSFLRFLANQYDVGYITSSVRDLQALCHTKEIASSPFFNIFSTMRLTAFSDEEALELIERPALQVGIRLQPHAEFIMSDLAGTFPLFLQIACSHMLEEVQERPREPDVNAVRKQYCEEVEPHYRFIWEYFDEHERAVVENVISGHRIPDSLRDVLADLEARRYVISRDQNVRVFSSTFEQFCRTVTAPQRPRSFWRRLLRPRQKK